MAHPTARKWVITPVINGISRVNPLIKGVITHLLSGMSHQVVLTGAFYVGLLDGLLGVAGMIITRVTRDYGSFPKIPCVKRTSKSM